MEDRQYKYLIGVLNINRCHEYINRCPEYIICIQILTYVLIFKTPIKYSYIGDLPLVNSTDSKILNEI